MTATPPHGVVLDPNVLKSAAMTPAGALGGIVTLIDAGTVTPILSQHLIDEAATCLAEPSSVATYTQPSPTLHRRM